MRLKEKYFNDLQSNKSDDIKTVDTFCEKEEDIHVHKNTKVSNHNHNI